MVCGIMLPYTMGLVGPQPAYAALAKRLGYTGNQTELSQKLVDHLFALAERQGLKTSMQAMEIDEAAYMANVERWAEGSLPAFATQMSPAEMTTERGVQMYTDIYYGNRPVLK